MNWLFNNFILNFNLREEGWVRCILDDGKKLWNLFCYFIEYILANLLLKRDSNFELVTFTTNTWVPDDIKLFWKLVLMKLIQVKTTTNQAIIESSKEIHNFICLSWNVNLISLNPHHKLRIRNLEEIKVKVSVVKKKLNLYNNINLSQTRNFTSEPWRRLPSGLIVVTNSSLQAQFYCILLTNYALLSVFLRCFSFI